MLPARHCSQHGALAPVDRNGYLQRRRSIGAYLSKRLRNLPQAWDRVETGNYGAIGRRDDLSGPGKPRHRIIDEYQVVVLPYVLGEGRTMFEGLDTKMNLSLTSTRSFHNGNVLLNYAAA